MTAYKNFKFFYSNCSSFAAASAPAHISMILDTVVLAVSILIVPVVRTVLLLMQN